MKRSELLAISDRIVREVREEAVRNSIAAAKRDLVGLILLATGWQALEPWAEEALDRALSGRPINVRALRASIDAWKSEKLGGSHVQQD